MNINVKVEKKEKEYNICVEGEVDAYTAPQMREKITPLTEESGMKIVLNLAGVNYMDSTGLGVIIGAYKSCEKYNSHLVLTGMSERVERLFEITGLTEIIDVEMKVRGESQ